jgi:hypothetical protein
MDTRGMLLAPVALDDNRERDLLLVGEAVKWTRVE